MCEPRMSTAPAPSSTAGSGNQSPLRTKPPTVVSEELGRTACRVTGFTASIPSQYAIPEVLSPLTLRLLLIVVNPELARKTGSRRSRAYRRASSGAARRPRRARTSGCGSGTARRVEQLGRCGILQAARWSGRRSSGNVVFAEVGQIEIVLVGARDGLPRKRDSRDEAHGERKGSRTAPSPERDHCRVRYGLAFQSVKAARQSNRDPRRVPHPAKGLRRRSRLRPTRFVC